MVPTKPKKNFKNSEDSTDNGKSWQGVLSLWFRRYAGHLESWDKFSRINQPGGGVGRRCRGSSPFDPVTFIHLLK